MNPITTGGNASAGLMRTVENLQTSVMKSLIDNGTQNSPATQAGQAVLHAGSTAKSLLAQGTPLYL